MNFVIDTVRIKNRNIEYLLSVAINEYGNEAVRLLAMNNEYFIERLYAMPNRDSSRNFIKNHDREFIKQELISEATSIAGPDS